jgi:hypothetical protein
VRAELAAVSTFERDTLQGPSRDCGARHEPTETREIAGGVAQMFRTLQRAAAFVSLRERGMKRAHVRQLLEVLDQVADCASTRC